MRRLVAALIVTVGVSFVTVIGDADHTERFGPVDQIRAGELRHHLEYIASDALEGRDALSPGFRSAADYVGARLREDGVTPAGDNGTYFQDVGIRRTTVDAARAVVTLGDTRLAHGTDFLAPSPGTASGGLVYVGHGWRVPSKQLDPFQGVDVKGRWLVILPGSPEELTPSDLARMAADVDFVQPEANARQLGAIGIVKLPSSYDLNHWARDTSRETTRGELVVDRLSPPVTRIPQITAASRLVEMLFKGEIEDGARMTARAARREAGSSFMLDPAKVLSVDVPTVVRLEHTMNVVGVVEGRDPALKNEYVALGAHLDHLGRTTDEKRTTGGDDINNGADDDGSGVVALVTMAGAVAKGPRPKRSLIFVWHTGEEYGSWGARYFVAFPPVPVDRIVAQLNVDMIGRARYPGTSNPGDGQLTGPNEVYLVGSRRLSRELGETCVAVNDAYMHLKFNYKYDAPNDPEKIYTRSDHYEYAQKGIPVVFFFTGLHGDYHRPSDEVSRIDFAKLQRVTRTVLATAWTLGNAPTRPRLDAPLQTH
jgi:Peptidase family M28